MLPLRPQYIVLVYCISRPSPATIGPNYKCTMCTVYLPDGTCPMYWCTSYYRSYLQVYCVYCMPARWLLSYVLVYQLL